MTDEKKERKKSSKRERAEQRRREAARQRRNSILQKLGFGVVAAALIALVVVNTGSPGSGVTDPAAWDLPAMGPTADTQERVVLADLRGKPTVANFFASWCTACDAELPAFRSVSTQFQDEINFVGVASQETGDPLLMPRRHDVEWWTLARDVGGANGDGLSRALGARGMPLTAFYDTEGRLVHVQLGALNEPQLRSTITQFFGIEA